MRRAIKTIGAAVLAAALIAGQAQACTPVPGESWSRIGRSSAKPCSFGTTGAALTVALLPRLPDRPGACA